MRVLPTLLTLMFLLPAATAQEDACSQEAPCPWIVDVDETGIRSEGRNVTVGDWYRIEAYNLDPERAHTLVLQGYDVQLEVPADGGEATSDPIHFDTPGIFSLDDETADDYVWLQVRETDVVDDEAGGDGDGDGADEDEEAGDDQNTPLPIAVGLMAVVAAVVLRRR